MNGRRWFGGSSSGAGGGEVTSVANKTGDVSLVAADIDDLGDSATLNVGTSEDTVAAGDDSRFAEAATRSGGGKEKYGTKTATGPNTTVDLGDGNEQMVTLQASTTLSLDGATDDTVCSCVVFFKQDAVGGRTLTFPAAVLWPGGGTPPTVTGVANSIDAFSFTTFDGGDSWFGGVVGLDYA